MRARISYIEAHGTGTKLGDPIEIAALNKAFGRTTQDRQFCLIGSAKSNIGHCEAAAGIAGLTKVLLQMQHRQVVPSLHSAQLNPHIDFANSPFTVNQTLTDWVAPVVDGRHVPRIAGLSSFGAGGSNAHMIVEEYEAPVSAPSSGPAIVVLSARTPAQLKQQAQGLVDFVAASSTPMDLGSLAYTLQVGREAMEERLGLVVESIDQLVETLQGYLRDEGEVEDLYLGQVKRHKELLTLFSTDADLRQAVDRWLSGRKYEKVVELWVKGLEVRWPRLYDGVLPRRMSLPTYPFAKERYWIDAGTGPVGATNGAAQLHPLLHANISDLYQQSYRSTFRGDESFCTPQGTLRETASLELARAAVEQAMRPQAAESIELRDVEWLSAVPASSESPVSIAVDALDAGGVGYEIYSASPEGERVHGRGEAVLLEDPARMRLDLAQLQSRMRAEAEGRRYRGDGEVLARVELSSSQRSGAEAYGLHPALLDGALDAARVLVGGDAVPASLSTLSVFAALPVSGWAWARSSSTGVDVDLCDEQGAVCASLRGWAFAFRSATDVVVAMPGVEPASAEALQAEAPAPRMAPLRIALQTRVDAPAPIAPALEIEVARHKPTGVALIDPLSLSSPSQWSAVVEGQAAVRVGVRVFGSVLVHGIVTGA